jgi:hypothetical protein
MKSLTSAVAVITLLATGIVATQAASRSGSSQSANQTTAQLNQQQLQMNGSDQQAAAPAGNMSAPRPMPQAGGTVIKGKVVPPGARCGNDNPSCAQQIGNPSVNSTTQMRLQGAQ